MKGWKSTQGIKLQSPGVSRRSASQETVSPMGQPKRAVRCDRDLVPEVGVEPTRF
jgi:hypothetical protein